MEIFYLVLGIFLLCLGIVDLLWTTFWVDGGSGPVSRRLTTFFWMVFRKMGKKKGILLSLYGPFILTVTLFTWVLLIWAGWVFVFASDTSALVDTRTDTPISWINLIYYVAFTMFTMGNGDFYPQEGIFQILTSLTTASGMLFVTIGASYIISVLGAVSQKRSFADSVTGLGENPAEIVEKMFNGSDPREIDLILMNLSSQVSSLTQQHKSFPLLHYYHSEKPDQAVALAMVDLDETLTLLEWGLTEDTHPTRILRVEIRSSINTYLETLNAAYIKPANQDPPLPDLNYLRNHDVPVVSDEEFRKNIKELQPRRRKLWGAVKADAWDWPL